MAFCAVWAEVNRVKPWIIVGISAVIIGIKLNVVAGNDVNNNGLLAKYNSSGTALWAETSQETAEGSLLGLTVKGSQVYAVGWVKGVASMVFGGFTMRRADCWVRATSPPAICSSSRGTKPFPAPAIRVPTPRWPVWGRSSDRPQNQRIRTSMSNMVASPASASQLLTFCTASLRLSD
jgi:hypothetical protein